MRTFVYLFTGLLFCLAFMVPGSAQSVRATRFSSAYTDLSKDCKAKFKKAAEGQDMPVICKGFGGYLITSNPYALGVQYSVENPKFKKGDDLKSILVGDVSSSGRRLVEWRMADGKPFAIIFRSDKRKDGDVDNTKLTKVLIVTGLHGFDKIAYEIDAKSANANVRAREYLHS